MVDEDLKIRTTGWAGLWNDALRHYGELQALQDDSLGNQGRFLTTLIRIERGQYERQPRSTRGCLPQWSLTNQLAKISSSARCTRTVRCCRIRTLGSCSRCRRRTRTSWVDPAQRCCYSRP